MDGTLVDTEEANWKVIERGCKNRDILGDDVGRITLTSDDKQRYVGTTIVSFLTKLFEGLGIKDFATKAKSIADTKVKILGELLSAGEVKGFDKIINLARTLKREDFKVALVTSSDRQSATLVLDHFKLHSCFDKTIVREDMNGRLKPNPYAYNLAMEKLNVKPHRTLVFEDSDPGIKSGRDSGAVVVALRNTREQKLTELRHHNIIPMDLVG